MISYDESSCILNIQVKALEIYNYDPSFTDSKAYNAFYIFLTFFVNLESITLRHFQERISITLNTK